MPPDASPFTADVLAGLARPQKAVPAKYLYDAEGSRLFDAITQLDAYYPTRTERALLAAHAPEIAAAIGPGAVLVEYGSGSSDKTRVLLDALVGDPYRLAAYVPVDIAPDVLGAAARALRARYPGLDVRPVAGDYTGPLALPDVAPGARRVVFFPGSTVGNFLDAEARAFFETAAGVAGPGGALVVGADLVKAVDVLLRAYDDEEGVTAAFNKNLLARMNRELGADADPAAWAHEARWNAADSRIEMHLRSLRDQALTVAGRTVSFRAGETLHTENSRKYGPGDLEGLAAQAGWRPARRWADSAGLFAVHLLTLP